MCKGKLLTKNHIQVLNEQVTKLKKMLRRCYSIYILDDKAPGVHGFNSRFYKHSLETVGDEVSDAILDFFRQANCLKL